MRLRKIAAATLVAALGLTTVASQAQAWVAVDGSGPAGGYQSMTGVGEGSWSEHSLTTFSTYLMPGGGGRWVCIDPLEKVPSVISVNSQQVNDPKLAWMLHTYSMTKDPYQAAALAYWTKQRYPASGGSSAAEQVKANEPADWAKMLVYIDALNDQATKYAGPYTMKTALTDTTVTGSVLTSSGQQLKEITPASNPRFETAPEVRINLINAKFADGSTSAMVTSGVAAKYTVINPAKEVVAEATLSGIPGTSYTLYSEAGYQRMVAKGTASQSVTDTDVREKRQASPSITTTASHSKGGTKVGVAITDTIRASEGKPGTTMKVPVLLYGPLSAKPAPAANAPAGAPVAWKGTVDINLDANGNGSATTAAYQPMAVGWYAYEADFPGDTNNAAFNTQYGDPAETGYLEARKPTAGTTASDKTDGDKYLVGEGPKTVVDVTAYTDLIPGVEHTIRGELRDKATGEGFTPAIIAEKKFTPKTSDGSVTLEFTVPESVKGKTLVAFERIYQGTTEVVAHADINDPAQTVTWPEIGTTATDKTDGDKYLTGDGEQIVSDEVTYKGLTPGETYTVEGELKDKATGEGFDPAIVATTEFTPETPDGTVTLDFTVPTTVQGKTLVAFEKVLHEGVEVAIHADIDDVEQTVYRPDLGTTATDKADGDKILAQTGEVIVSDEVAYTGLEPGKTYTVAGELVDKATGKGFEPAIVATTEFTPETPDGTVVLDFTVPAAVQGKTLIAFETVLHEGVEVAIHADIEDKAQTVYRPDLGTSAVDQADGDKILAAGGGTIIDTVTYTGLEPGQTYVVDGELQDKATGKPTGIKGKAEFTAESTDGNVEVEFKVPSGYAGKTLVAFETVSLNGVQIASHVDLNDAAQTVNIYAGDMEEGGGLIDSGDPLQGNGTPLMIGGLVVLGLAGAVGAGLFVRRRRPLARHGLAGEQVA